MARTVTLTIPGLPKPKGSMKCVGRRGRVMHQILEDAGPELRAWRVRITDAAQQSPLTATPHEPIHVDVTFTLPRPGYQYGTGRNAGAVKATHLATLPTGRGTGDVDKLVRTLLDAMQDGGLLDDDAQVVQLVARKHYVDDELSARTLPYPGAHVVVTFPNR